MIYSQSCMAYQQQWMHMAYDTARFIVESNLPASYLEWGFFYCQGLMLLCRSQVLCVMWSLCFCCRHYTSYQQLKGGTVGERIAGYLAAAEQHPAVLATLYHPEQLDYKQQLLESYARYADGSANSMMARDAKKD